MEVDRRFLHLRCHHLRSQVGFQVGLSGKYQPTRQDKDIEHGANTGDEKDYQKGLEPADRRRKGVPGSVPLTICHQPGHGYHIYLISIDCLYSLYRLFDLTRT